MFIRTLVLEANKYILYTYLCEGGNSGEGGGGGGVVTTPWLAGEVSCVSVNQGHSHIPMHGLLQHQVTGTSLGREKTSIIITTSIHNRICEIHVQSRVGAKYIGTCT